MIEAHPENTELTNIYAKLLEKGIDLEVAYLKSQEELDKDWWKNITERIKSDNDTELAIQKNRQKLRKI